MSPQGRNTPVQRRLSLRMCSLGGAFLVLTSSLVACVGRVDLGTDKNTINGRPGDQAFAFVGFHITGSAPSSTGSQDATYQNLKVKVGGLEATIVDVLVVQSTRWPRYGVRGVVFNIPDLSPGRHQLTILQNGTPLADAISADYSVVVPLK